MAKFAKSPLRYPGGKSRALYDIHAQLPADFREYREPFVGGGSVYLSVKSQFKQRIQTYWINDIYYDLYCFWTAVQQDLEALVKRVEFYKHNYTDGRVLYQELKGMDDTISDFDRAARFFVMNRITFSGVMDAGGYSNQAFERRFTDSSIERLAKLGYYLQGTTITHDDYAEVVLKEGKDVFIFLDPPYWSATQSKLYGKRGELHTAFDHDRFAETMRTCPHRWLITYDDSPKIRELFAFADISEWQLQYGMNNYKQGRAAKGKELFIKNY